MCVAGDDFTMKQPLVFNSFKECVLLKSVELPVFVPLVSVNVPLLWYLGRKRIPWIIEVRSLTKSFNLNMLVFSTSGATIVLHLVEHESTTMILSPAAEGRCTLLMSEGMALFFCGNLLEETGLL